MEDTDACSMCGAPYVVFRDIANEMWRFLCHCEVSEKCGKCKRPKLGATHAKLYCTGEVERFVCDEHGVSPEDRPEEPERPPPKAKAREVEKVGTSRVRVRNVPTHPKRDLLTLEGFRESFRDEGLRGICLNCQRVRDLADSRFNPVWGTPLFDLVCPYCESDKYQFIK